MLNGILLTLYILFLPTQFGKHFFLDASYISGVRIDYLAPTFYVTDIICLAFILFNFSKLTTFFKNKFTYIFLVLAVVNIFFALQPFIALYKFIKYLEIIFVFIIFRDILKTPAVILIAFLSSGIIELLLSILQLLNKHAIQGLFYFLGERYMTLSTPDIAKASLNGVEILRAYGTFSHPNSMAGFYLLVYFFVLISPLFSKKTFLKYATMGVSAALIFCTFSKIPITIFFILNVIYLIKNPQVISCTFCRYGRIIILGIISLLFLFTQGDKFSLIKRTDLIDNALTIIVQHPLIGTGFGNYVIAQSQFPIKYSYFFLQPVHNIFLLFISESGLIISSFLFYLLFRNRKKIRQLLKKNQTFVYLASIVLLTGMFDHYWLTLQQNLLLLPLVFALL